MNIEIANKLVQLRKKNGFSQEALAEKLGISRQAISKWERAEASPDTDNLITLAKLYGVSLDDLLLVESNGQTGAEEDGDKVHIGLSGIHVAERGGNEVHVGPGGIHV